MSQNTTISSRGAAIAARIPTFFDVLQDIWHPEENPDGVVNLGLAENALMHFEMLQHLNSQACTDYHGLTYGDGFIGSNALKSSLCQFLNHYFKPYKPLTPSKLVATAGVSNALECCAWSLCSQDDYILIGRPYWTTFKTVFGNRARVFVEEVEFGATDPFSLEALHHFEETYETAKRNGKNIRAILLCNPHNPLGRCYPKEVIEQYMKFCSKKQIHLISDEIYALSIHGTENEETRFTSALSIDTNTIINPELVHVLWGMSKVGDYTCVVYLQELTIQDFGATGLRIGCVISQANTSFLESCTSFSLFNFPSSMADKAAASLLSNQQFTDGYVTVYQDRLRESYRYTVATLEAHGIPCQKSNAALFVWANLGAAINSDVIADGELLKRLREEKVYITSGEGYRSEQTGWFRIVCAHPQATLEEGLGRIIRTLKKL